MANKTSASAKNKTDYLFYLVSGLSEDVMLRTPNKRITRNKLLPNLTDIARHYGMRQKDIYACFLVAGGEPGDVDYDRFLASYNGASELEKVDLWDWDGETDCVSFYRPRLFTQQMEYAEKAGVHANTFPEGHPGHCDPAHAHWVMTNFFWLDNFGKKEDWLAWYDVELEKHRAAGTESEFLRKANDRYRAITVLQRDDKFYVWEGNERIAGAFKNNDDGLMALVGKVDVSLEQNNDKQIVPDNQEEDPDHEQGMA